MTTKPEQNHTPTAPTEPTLSELTPTEPTPSAATSLETIIDTTPSSSVETSLPSQVQLLPLDEYVSRFSNRYKTEKVFQTIVHKYLGLGKVDKVKLGFGKMFRKEWYAQKTETLIHEYALKIRTSIEEALQVQQDLQQLEQAKQQVSKVQKEADTSQQQEQQQRQVYQAVVEQEQAAIQAIVQETESKKQAEQQRKQDLLTQIQQKPAAAEIIKQKLAEKLEASGYLKKDGSGNISFNESRIVDRLGEMFLNEIVQEIEDTDGRGFMNQVQTAYTGLISHWAELEDLIELPSVDWVQTIIYSRSKGYRVPKFPHYITGKAAEENQRIRVAKCVNAAMVVDSSGSMKENNRFEMAKKTVLGTRAMMRNLDNKNEIDLAHYNDNIYPLLPEQLLKNQIYPDNGTRTDLALQWLLKTLHTRTPALAYLVTDGQPNSMSDTLYEAKKFQEYPAIMLRIFLIDGEKTAQENIRQICKAAGHNTKVSMVQNYQLGTGVIKDLADALGEMQSIDSF